jgi:hypothetical protein
MTRPFLLKLSRKSLAIALVINLLVSPLSSLVGQAQAATLTGSKVAISDSRPSGTSVSYDIEFDSVTTSAIQCIRVEFDTQADGGGSKPSGLDITSLALSGSTDYIPTPGSWGVSNNNSTGVSSITFGSGETPASATDRNVILTTITNGSTPETGYYVIFNTYNNTNCSSSGVDSGTGTFIYVTGQSVSLSVDPSISFDLAAVSNSQSVNGATTSVTTTDGTIPFGTVTTSTSGIAAHDATVTTNAGSGYTMYIRYTQAPTTGAASIDDHSGSNASPTTMSPGTEAFGYTTNDATLGTGTADRFTSSGGNKWAAFTTSNAEVGYSGTSVSSQTIRLGYQVGISGTTPAGAYGSSTVIITATPAY